MPTVYAIYPSETNITERLDYYSTSINAWNIPFSSAALVFAEKFSSLIKIISLLITDLIGEIFKKSEKTRIPKLLSERISVPQYEHSRGSSSKYTP